MSDITLACRDVVAGYGDVEVLHGVSIEVRAGAIRALLGNNGAGKTTLMRTIAGVLPARRGALVDAGRSIEKLGAADRVAAGIALVPEGRLVFPELSVADNLRLGAYTNRARKDLARTEKMYGMFPRLRERRWQMAGVLSGGEQQMLSLARGLMSEPTLLLRMSQASDSRRRSRNKRVRPSQKSAMADILSILSSRISPAHLR